MKSCGYLVCFSPKGGSGATKAIQPDCGGRHGDLPYTKISTTSADVGKIKIVYGEEFLYILNGEKNVTVVF